MIVFDELRLLSCVDSHATAAILPKTDNIHDASLSNPRSRNFERIRNGVDRADPRIPGGLSGAREGLPYGAHSSSKNIPPTRRRPWILARI